MRFIKRIGYYLYSVFEMVVHFKNWLTLWPVFLKKRLHEPREVRLRQPPVRLTIRGRMDLWSVKETFLDQFYTRYGVEVEDGWTVLDIGAGVGDFSIYAAYGKPHAVIYALEPFVESYQILVQNLTLNAIDNVLVYPHGLWQETGRISLNISGGEPLQIMSQGLDETINLDDMGTVKALSLEDFLREIEIPQVDLMKMDCEGAEYEILLGASSQAMKRIDRLIMEYHDIGERRNHQVLVPFLKEMGYDVRRVKNLVHPDLGYLYATRQPT
jgi:FkbM family methyltransferase